MSRVLVTGAGGSIGCHVVDYLIERTTHHIVALDSFRHKGMTDRLAVVLDKRNHVRDCVTVLTHDLSAPISPMLAKKIGDVEWIINLASLSDVFASIENPVPFIKNNVDVALNVLEFARQVKPAAFLQVSTDEVYGPTDGKHLHREWDPIVPSSPYSASKAAQEAIAIAYWRTYNVPLILVNLMNNFGEMQSPAKFPAIVQEKLMHGEPVTIHGTPTTVGSRCYLHSYNTADAFVWLLSTRLPHLHEEGTMDKPDRFNIIGEQVNNEDLARMIATEMKVNDPVIQYEDFHATRPGHDRHYGLDGTKMAATAWEAPIDFRSAIARTVRWQQEHPEWLQRSKS